MAKDDSTFPGKLEKAQLEEYKRLVQEVRREEDIWHQARQIHAANHIKNLKTQEALQTQIEELIKDKDPKNRLVNEAEEKARIKFLDLQIKKLEETKKIQKALFDDDRDFQKQLGKITSEEIAKKEIILNLEKKLYEVKGKSSPATKKDITLIEMLHDAAQGTTRALAPMSEQLKRIGLETAAFSMLIPDLDLSRIASSLLSLPDSMDKSFRSIIKAGYSFDDHLKEIFTTIIDPVNSANKEFDYINKEMAKSLFTNVGILSEEASAGLLAVKNNVSIARREWISASRENQFTAISMANLAAGLKKLGVAEEDTTKNLEFFIKGLKQTPAVAQESIRRLTNIAHSLDINVSKSFKDFVALQGDLAQWGDRTVSVFADLQAQAVATGVEVGALTKVASKLDTFKGAAQAAQGFNAVLGKTVLSVTDLVHAEPAEKINLLRDAMDRSGLSFETANRRVRSIIASLLGVNVAEASKIFGSKEDYFDISSGMDKTAESHDDLTNRINQTMTTGEKVKAMHSSLARGMDNILVKARSSADEMSHHLLNVFTEIREKTASSQAAVAGFLGLVAGAGRAVTAAKRTAGWIATAGVGLAIVDALRKELGYKVPAPILRIIKKVTGEDLDVDTGPKTGARARPRSQPRLSSPRQSREEPIHHTSTTAGTLPAQKDANVVISVPVTIDGVTYPPVKQDVGSWADLIDRATSGAPIPETIYTKPSPGASP